MAPLIVFDAVALAAGLVAAVTDLRSGKIPNRLTVPLALGGIALHAVLGGGQRAGASLVGLLLAGLVPWVLYFTTRGGAIGGGDVKLFAALGAVLGGVQGLEVELAACVLVATFALVRLAFAGRLLAVLGNSLRLVVNRFLPAERRREIPTEAMMQLRMGPSIALAVLYVCVMNHAPRWVSWLS